MEGETIARFEIPLNEVFENFSEKRDSMMVPGSGQYYKFSRPINSSSWDGASYSINVSNIAQNRLILGNKCYLKFRCYASKGEDAPIVDADGVYLRPDASNLIIGNTTVGIAGSQVHNDNNSPITRFWQQHLEHNNSTRKNGQFRHYFTLEDSVIDATAPSDTTAFKKEITNKKEFTIIRNLNDISFFGHRDSAIPGLLPVDIQFNLNSQGKRLFFCTAAETAVPSLYIYEVELVIYTIETQPEIAQEIRTQLAGSNLYANTDKWQTKGMNAIASAETAFDTQNETIIETCPDVLGLCFYPTSTFDAATPYKGAHPMKTSWCNVENVDVRNYGAPVRSYRRLGNNSTIGQKIEMATEMSSLGNDNLSPIDIEMFQKGSISFVPVVYRRLKDPVSTDTRPSSITASARFNPSAGQDSKAFVWYKIRQVWRLGLNVGDTMVIR